MELKPFVANFVNAGQPLTAQAWNDVISAIDDAYKFIRATTHVVKVKIINKEIDNRQVRVVATSTTNTPVEAVRPIARDGDHVLVELSIGDYTITAEALGYDTGTAPLSITAAVTEQEVLMELKPGQVIMPDVFGLKLITVRDALKAVGIKLTQLFDFLGASIPAAEPPAELADSPVLVQLPRAGDPVDPTVGARLVIAVAPKIESAIEVPSLVGMTETEARKVLAELGLTSGKSEFREK